MFRKTAGGFRFSDPRRTVASGRGLQKVVVKVARDRSVVLRANGKHVQLRAPRPGELELTVGFRSLTGGAAQNRCSDGVAAFRAGPQGRLIAP